MSDTDGHTDHAALDEAHELLRMWSMLFDTDKKQAVSRIAVGINALAAERDALAAAFRELASRYTARDMYGDIGLQEIVDRIAARHGVAAILADD